MIRDFIKNVYCLTFYDENFILWVNHKLFINFSYMEKRNLIYAFTIGGCGVKNDNLWSRNDSIKFTIKECKEYE